MNQAALLFLLSLGVVALLGAAAGVRIGREWPPNCGWRNADCGIEGAAPATIGAVAPVEDGRRERPPYRAELFPLGRAETEAAKRRLQCYAIHGVMRQLNVKVHGRVMAAGGMN